jgi:AmmeMemoRadiSam system protein A
METEAKRVLLELAREAVVATARGAPRPAVPEPVGRLPELAAPRGAFVTLRGAQGDLRGCIGTTAATRPLGEVVVEMAEAAASRDPRFPPVDPAELPGLHMEVSVLYPLEPVSALDEVQIGAHGLVAEGFGRRGLLLPQVASERGWDVETFARQTCVKAGLPPTAYRDTGVRLYRFRAEVFEEA